MKTPINRVRSAVPESCQETLDLLIGMCPLPRDQPRLAHSVANLAYSLVCYAERVGPLKDVPAKWVEHARLIHQEITNDCVLCKYWEPEDSLQRRLKAYPQLALLHVIQEGQRHLMIALGAEVMSALLNSRALHPGYCNNLRLDAQKVCVYEPVTGQQIADLADLGFGKKWKAGFKRRDAETRKWIELGAEEPVVKTGAQQLIDCLRNALEYPKPKRKQGVNDDSCATIEQYCAAASDLRRRIEEGDDDALLQAMCLLTPFTPESLVKLPLVLEGQDIPPIALSVEEGLLLLNIAALLPGRAKAAPDRPQNNWLKVPWPSFIKDALVQRSARCSSAQTVGGLLQSKVVRPIDVLLQGEVCKFPATLARVRKSTSLVCLDLNIERLVAAYQCLDFSMVAKARLYYARVTGAEIYAGCKRLYGHIAWGEPCVQAVNLPDVGSCVTPSHECMQEVFAHLSQCVKDTFPSSRTGLQGLLTHLNHYTRYCTVLTSFCLGLREAEVYALRAHDLVHGQRELVVHDKNRQAAQFAQPMYMNALLHQQISKYLLHMQSLLMRLEQVPQLKDGVVARRLRSILQGEGMLFQHFDPNGQSHDVGARWAWEDVQAKFHVPANAGRHFWQNELRAAGLRSLDIDRFMRHVTLGVETYTNSQVEAPRNSMLRIEAVQLQSLKNMHILPVAGLIARGVGI